LLKLLVKLSRLEHGPWMIDAHAEADKGVDPAARAEVRLVDGKESIAAHTNLYFLSFEVFAFLGKCLLFDL